MGGWIKLYRQMQEHELWDEKRIFSKAEAWLDLLMMANHKARNILIDGQMLRVERGQVFRSELKLSERWGWSRNKTRAFFLYLEKNKMSTTKGTTKGTTITLINYEHYQGEGATESTTIDTAEGTAESTAQGTTEGTADGTQTRSKEREEGKERKNIKPKPKPVPKKTYAEFVTMTEAEYGKLIAQYGAERVSRMITILNNYKGANGKKYTSDYMAILNWVVEREAKENPQQTVTPIKQPPPQNKKPSEQHPPAETVWLEVEEAINTGVEIWSMPMYGAIVARLGFNNLCQIGITEAKKKFCVMYNEVLTNLDKR